MRIHVARENETLWELATQYNVPIGRLLEMNPKLKEDQPLQSGNKVKIPTGKVPVLQAEPREKRRTEPRKERRTPRKQRVTEEEIPFMESPQMTIDPHVFFMEQGDEQTQELPREAPPYPGMYPCYMPPPPYLSYYPGPMHHPYHWPAYYPYGPYSMRGYESDVESSATLD